jgi:hypothetical protein
MSDGFFFLPSATLSHCNDVTLLFLTPQDDANLQAFLFVLGLETKEKQGGQ